MSERWKLIEKAIEMMDEEGLEEMANAFLEIYELIPPEELVEEFDVSTYVCSRPELYRIIIERMVKIDSKKKKAIVAI